VKHPSAAHECSDIINHLADQDFFDLAADDRDRLLNAFFGTVKHFFGDVTDPRSAEKITYPIPALAFLGMLMFLCHLSARRQIQICLRYLPTRTSLQSPTPSERTTNCTATRRWETHRIGAALFSDLSQFPQSTQIISPNATLIPSLFIAARRGILLRREESRGTFQPDAKCLRRVRQVRTSLDLPYGAAKS
jgi:hypothetical protein